jgi:hypothetical protein
VERVCNPGLIALLGEGQGLMQESSVERDAPSVSEHVALALD